MYEWTHRQRSSSIHLHSTALAALTPGKLDRELPWHHCNNCLTTAIAPTTTTASKISKSTQVDRSIKLLERCASNDFLNSNSSTPNQKDSKSRMNKWKESLNSCDSLVEFVRMIELIIEDSQDFGKRRRVGDDILNGTEFTIFDGNDFNMDCDDSSNICCKCTNTKVTDKEIQTTPMREISVPVKQVLEALEIPLSNKSTIPPPPPMPLDLTPVSTRCHRVIKREYDVIQPIPPPPPPPPLPNGLGKIVV